MAKTQEELIDIYLPLLPEDDGTGHIDQTIPVTINGVTTLIKRGERVQIKPEVFEALYNSGKFPNL